jgi:hypothetical protein
MRKLAEWHGKTDDTRPPPRVRLRIFDVAGGVCHVCKLPIKPDETWHADHVIALIEGGENRETNIAPAMLIATLQRRMRKRPANRRWLEPAKSMWALPAPSNQSSRHHLPNPSVQSVSLSPCHPAASYTRRASMTDKMEPVAWIDFYSATFLKTAAYRVARVTSYPDEIKKIPLYTADQVKELTERLDASDKERVDAVARNMAHIERWNKAEAALAEARKVIEDANRGLEAGVSQYAQRDLHRNIVPGDEQYPG